MGERRSASSNSSVQCERQAVFSVRQLMLWRQLIDGENLINHFCNSTNDIFRHVYQVSGTNEPSTAWNVLILCMCSLCKYSNLVFGLGKFG